MAPDFKLIARQITEDMARQKLLHIDLFMKAEADIDKALRRVFLDGYNFAHAQLQATTVAEKPKTE